MYKTLVEANEVATNLDNPTWVVVDCRFSLDDTELGRRQYCEGHVPGAVYAHVDEDLSARVIPGATGRHPLPDPEVLASTFGSWGIGDGMQVVAYDDAAGAMAARLWWLLKWLGHQAVAVLDGGWSAWVEGSHPVSDTAEAPAPRQFTPRLQSHMVATTAEVEALLEDPAYRLLDARAADRFRGENETIDPVAGHIPGAISAPYEGNLDEAGRFLSRAELRERYERLLGPVPVEHAIAYCGSGVTGAHNVLAIAHAGLGEAKLYAGSWSKWITDPQRPVSPGTP